MHSLRLKFISIPKALSQKVLFEKFSPIALPTLFIHHMFFRVTGENQFLIDPYLQIILSTEDKVSPGDSAELTVKGQKGTHVGLSVLDKATLLRNGTNVLQRNKVSRYV